MRRSLGQSPQRERRCCVNKKAAPASKKAEKQTDTNSLLFLNIPDLLRGIQLSSPQTTRRRMSLFSGFLIEQFSQLFGHGTTKLFGIDDRQCALVIARHVVPDTDGQKIDRRTGSRSRQSLRADVSPDKYRH